MDASKEKDFRDVDEYLTHVQDRGQRQMLEQLRDTIKQTVPEATEIISYQMPAYTYHGILLYFAAWKNHWGLYPASQAIKDTFRDELARYKQTKGAIQFPWDEPFPKTLIIRIIKKRMAENLEAERLKG